MANHPDTFKLVVPKRTRRAGSTNKTIKVPVTCKLRAKLYEPQLVLAQAHFRDMADPNMVPPLAAGHIAAVDRRLWYALTGARLKGLLESLADILDDYVAWGVRLDIQAGNPGPPAVPWQTYAEYFSTLIDVPAGVANFNVRYPLINDAVATLREYFVENIRLACERITANWTEIENGFFDPPNGETLDALYEFTCTGSDFHKQGKQVLILTFAYTTAGAPGFLEERAKRKRRNEVARRSGNTLNTQGYLRKVVYKPTDVEIDYRIMGNTARVHPVRLAGPFENPRQVPGAAATGSLMELMNTILAATVGGWNAAEELPTYTILPYNPGSSIAGNPPGPATGNSYGYLEFLTNHPVIKNKNKADPLPASTAQVKRGCDAAGGVWRNIAPPNPPDMDCVTDQAAPVDTCFRTWGRLAAIAQVCSISDMHVQNVIMHKCKPHLIDLEDSFKWRMTGVGQTGMFGGGTTSCDNPRYPNTIFNRKTKLDNPPAVVCGVHVGPPEYSACLLYRYNAGGQPVRQTLANNQAETHAGFDQVINALGIVAHNTALCNWVALNLAHTITRFVAMPTRHYYDQLSAYVENCADHAPLNPAVPLGFGNAILNRGFLFEESIKAARSAMFGPKVLPPTALAMEVAAPTGVAPVLPAVGAAPATSAWPAAEAAIDREKWTPTCLPTHVLEYPDYNWLDTVHYDIGNFNRRLSTQELLNSAGANVNVHAAWTWQNARLQQWTVPPPVAPTVAQINAVRWNELHRMAHRSGAPWGPLPAAGVPHFFPETALAMVDRQIQYLLVAAYRADVIAAGHLVMV